MFQVNLINDEYTELHSPVNDTRLLTLDLEENINSTNELNFSFTPNNPGHGLIRPRITRLVVTRVKDGKSIFEGRVIAEKGGIDSDNTTEQNYTAEGILGVLRDSWQSEFEYEGALSGLIKQLLNTSNDQLEDWKHIELGVCEIDTYKFYPDDDTPTNIVLTNGMDATIKPTTKHIYLTATDNNALNISPLVLGVTHTVEGSLTNGRYWLRHPTWGMSGWVKAEDIVETYISGGGSTGNNDMSGNVKIKDSATTYYVDSYTSVGQPIRDDIRKSTTLTINNENNGRYALFNDGKPVAWINKSDVIIGSRSSGTGGRPDYLEEKRIVNLTITAGNTLDVLLDQVINVYGGEIEVVNIEGVYTLNIYNQLGKESDLPIAWGYNMLDIEEDFDSSEIVTGVIANGNRPEDVEGEPIELSEVVYCDDLVEIYGIKIEARTYDDVKNETDLKQKAIDDMQSQLDGYFETTSTVLDLGVLDEELDGIELGNWHIAEVADLKTNGTRRIISRALNLLDIGTSSVTFGIKRRSLINGILERSG